MLKHPFLEVTYRKGKPFAGYLYLSETQAQEPCRTEEVRPGVLVDVSPDGEVLGIEFLSPGHVTPEDLQAISQRLRGIEVLGWELQNMLALGRLMAHAALVRTETRGVHFRSDWPERDDAHWQKHILMARDQELRIE